MKYKVTVETYDSMAHKPIYTNVLEFETAEEASEAFNNFADGCSYGFPESQCFRSRHFENDAKVTTPKFTSIIRLRVTEQKYSL